MEIWRLASHPGEESRQCRLPAQRLGVCADPAQFRIAERRVQGAVADRMERYGFPPSPALRHRMVPFDPPPQRAPAKPAVLRPCLQRRLAHDGFRPLSLSVSRIRKLSKFQP